MNCKNCEYAIKCRSLQDNEWYTRCTYEEGECEKITELEALIEKMKADYDKLLDEKIELENRLAESRECY